jgi:hypothetical protein
VVLIVVAVLVVAKRLLVTQHRIVRQNERRDLERADEDEATPPYDPTAPARAAEDFNAAGDIPLGMRGVRDPTFDEP